MKMLKPKETNKTFYNKWLYKISLYLPGISILRIKSNNLLFNFLAPDGPEDKKYPTSTHAKARYNRDAILQLVEFLGKYQDDLWFKRLERDTIDIYTNDKDFYTSLSTTFQLLVTNLYQPLEKNIELLTASDKIITKKLPHNKYRFKVYLLPHKLANDDLGKKKYLQWLDSQKEKILITPSVKKWFMTTNWNWDRRYVYVEDPSTLLLLKLRNSETIGRSYEYVIVDK